MGGCWWSGDVPAATWSQVVRDGTLLEAALHSASYILTADISVPLSAVKIHLCWSIHHCVWHTIHSQSYSRLSEIKDLFTKVWALNISHRQLHPPYIDINNGHVLKNIGLLFTIRKACILVPFVLFSLVNVIMSISCICCCLKKLKCKYWHM